MKINGSLVFDASSASEIQNLRVQKIAGESVTTYTATDAGRVIFVTTTGGGYVANTLYYGSAGASAWVAIATGGNAAALQTEVDNIETSLGSIVNTAGQFVVNQVTGPAFTGSESSLTALLQALSDYAAGNDTLAELNDVTLTAPATGDFLRKSAGNWVNHVLVLANVTDVTVPVAQLNLLTGLTASAAELNILDNVTGTVAADISSIAGYAGAGVSAIEFGYLNNVTSPIQTQLNGLQAGDPTLAALAVLDATAGFLVQTGADTFVKRTLVQPSQGITISEPAGTGGNPTFALANDLAALEGLTTNGLIVRSGDGTATTTTVTGTAGRVSVLNGTGVGGDPTIDLVTVSDIGSGAFLKFTRDAYGRVSGTTAVVTGDITTLVDTTYVNIGGDTMTGNLIMGANFVTMDNAPTLDNHAANKAYVDSIAAGLSWKNAVVAASTGNEVLAPAAAMIDGVTLVSGNRVLLKNQTAPAENGIYVFDGTNLVRASDMNTAAEFAAATVFVTSGTANADSGWTQTSEVVTVGTTAVSFSQFSGASTYTWGTGLGNTGNTIFVKLGAGIAELPSDEIGIDVVSNLALQLQGTASGDKLTFVLEAGSGLEQSATGLKVSANGITNAMILNDGFGLLADSGTDFLPLGDSLHVSGVSTQGMSVAVSESPAGTSKFTITAADASASQKGVASFNATEFSVTAGAVSIGTISNGKLANSFISFAGDTGTDQVALGETITFKDGGTHQVAGRLVDATIGSNDVTLKLRQATASLPGVASFDAGQFAVTAGAVSLNASIDDLNNVSAADSATTGDLLTKTAGDWQPVSRAAMVGSVALNDIGDVAATHTDGHVLVSDGTNWVNQKMYHLHTEGSAATTWTVVHNLGQRYCNVTIVDATENVVIPQSIVFDSTTTLTVTFNTALAGKVVVMGIA